MTITLELPPMYPKQAAAIDDPARISVVEASTKAGKTLGCMLWLVAQAIRCKPGQNVWWVAPVYTQAEIAFRRTKQMLRQGDPRGSIWKAHEGERVIILNGVRMCYRSAEHPDRLYGEDVHACVMDEATRIREESWHAVRSTLTATKGPLRIIGNVKGRKNWAYRLARMAEQGAPNMAHHKLTCWDAAEGGVITREEIEEARSILPEAIFRELYEAEPGEDAGNPFGGSAVIRRCITPISSKPPIAYGADLAKHQDWTVLVGLDEDGNTAHFSRWQSDWEDTTARLEREIGDEAAYIDATGVGDPIVERLSHRCPYVEGKKFTASTKQGWMLGLANSIQKQEIGYPDGPIVGELEEFEYVVVMNEKTGITTVHYTAPVGLNDDCVMALALADECRRLRPSDVTLSSVAIMDSGLDDDDELGWSTDDDW